MDEYESANHGNRSSAGRSESFGGGRGLNAAGFKMFNRILDWITNDRMQLINVTDRINEIVRKSGVRDGIVHLQSLHTTTAVFHQRVAGRPAARCEALSRTTWSIARNRTGGTTTRNIPIASARTPIRICAA